MAVELRGERRRFKLRFRRNGQQRVRYLGVDERVAELVRRQLAELQKRRRNARLLRAAVRAARRALRESKRALEPELIARGYRYHGYAIRRRRRPAVATPEERAVEAGTNAG